MANGTEKNVNEMIAKREQRTSGGRHSGLAGTQQAYQNADKVDNVGVPGGAGGTWSKDRIMEQATGSKKG